MLEDYRKRSNAESAELREGMVAVCPRTPEIPDGPKGKKFFEWTKSETGTHVERYCILNCRVKADLIGWKHDRFYISSLLGSRVKLELNSNSQNHLFRHLCTRIGSGFFELEFNSTSIRTDLSRSQSKLAEVDELRVHPSSENELRVRVLFKSGSQLLTNCIWSSTSKQLLAQALSVISFFQKIGVWIS